MPSNATVDVLVVGAGPAGLAIACDLQRRGISLRIISAASGGFEGSRAKGIQPRTLEVLDDLGVLADIEQHSTLYPKLGLHLGPVTVPKTMIKHHPKTEDVPHPNTLLVAQYDTDAAFRRRLNELGAHVEFDTRLISFENEPDAVVATVDHRDGEHETIRARFLVGADGGASRVRHCCGIDFPGTTDNDDRMIVADVTIDGLERNHWHIWPRVEGRSLAVCPLPDGKFQVMLKLKPDDKVDVDTDDVSRLVARAVEKAKHAVREVHWSSVWRPNIRLAERYRSGRVFLIGDAAHVHPPTGGQGMNTGIQDAYNLAWKLGQHLAGAPDTLLDTYEAERRPVAARVLGLSSEIYAKLGEKPLAGATRGDEERQLTLTYAGGPLASPTTVGAGSTPGPGDRAPDAVFVAADGRPTRIHDSLRGPHFTLLCVGEGAEDASATVRWPSVGDPLTTVVIPEPGPGLTRIYGITEPTLILVRPDGYIAVVEPASRASAIAAFVALAAPPINT